MQNQTQITNPGIKKAIDALQAHDYETWKSCFIAEPIFTDDGKTLNFFTFFSNAFDKKEKFLSLDKVVDGGREIHGNFYAGQWGTFKVYFRFYETADGKFSRLDIGQARL